MSGSEYRKVTCYLPKKSRKRNKKHIWHNIYWRRDGKTIPVDNDTVLEADDVVSDTYQTNFLYKDTTKSLSSDIFDYYKILKPGLQYKNLFDDKVPRGDVVDKPEISQFLVKVPGTVLIRLNW